ncbi:protein DpdH [Gordonia sp. CPCC 205515]|uniref:protein DpdH n=1 Tax=Gordonia sp. CPCC 205515 TaxID=3140791 RepID=UPI003AF37BD5
MSWQALRPTLCWDRNSALDIIPVEAETPSDAVFDATHSNLPILRRNRIDDEHGEVVYEDQLLDAVESQPPDYPILPILGHSGTGKSHLVRWLRMKLETSNALAPNRRVIFVPKHKMSLRAILDLILSQTQTQEADAFRERVHAATEKLTHEGNARLQLRSRLADLIAAQADSPSAAEETAESAERMYLATELPNLLLDPHFRARLLADDGAIARLVREKLFGKGPEDKDEPFAFTDGDLYLSVDDADRASAAAQEIAETLNGDEPLRTLAARMLNEQLTPAVSWVFGVGGDDLKDLLIELRLELGRNGEEILLLIEDFSIFQGVQGGLIDAMTQIATKNLPLCPMKVVMAVTTGYFRDQIPDTAKTRTYQVFDMDVPGESVAVDAVEFASRYLNAVRVGTEGIDSAFAERDGVPNACDMCTISARCRASFGERDGISLFPFNESALNLAIESQQSDDRGFVARDVLNRVLRPVLQEDREALEQRRFPPREFATRFSSRATAQRWNVEETALIQAPGETEEMVQRRQRLLTFWSAEPQAQNLDPAVHDAFSIPEVPGLRQWNSPGPRPPGPRPPGPRPPGPRPPGPRPPAPPPTDPPLVEALDLWSQGEPLKQAPQNALRRLAYSSIVTKLNFEDGLRGNSSWTLSGTRTVGDESLAGSPLFGQTAIFFEGTKRTDRPAIRLDISRNDTDAVRTLRALAHLDASNSWTEISHGADLQRLTFRQVDKWARQIETQLALYRYDPTAIDPEVGYLTDALILSAQLLGVESSYTEGSAAKKIAAVFAPPPPSDPSLLPPALRQLRAWASSEKSSRDSLQRLLLRRVSYTQGGGRIAGVDVNRILQSHKVFQKSPTTPPSVSSDVAAYVERLRSSAEALDAIHGPVEAMLPPTSTLDFKVKETVKAVAKTLQMLQTTGMTPARVDVNKIIELGQPLDASDLHRVAKLRQQLATWDTLSAVEKLEALSGNWPSSAARLAPWIEAVSTGLDSIEAHINTKIDSELQSHAEKLDNDLTDALNAALASASAIVESGNES